MGSVAPVLDLESIRAGGKAALARALSRLETDPDSPATLALLDAAFGAAQGRVIGLTGPPGVGKSTLMSRLIQHWRSAGLRVGCIAVDPSSRRSGGALLGDRTRLVTDPEDQNVFVRSMAARDRLGGVAEVTVAAMVLMRALFDRVLIETVGVGQSETDVAALVDSVLFCVQPGSGDSLQFMKAGIAEIPDIVVVTKADLESAARAGADVAAALALAPPSGWKVPVLAVAAPADQGVTEVLAALDQHHDWLTADGTGPARRHAQAEQWLVQAIRDRFGRDGLRRAGVLTLPPGYSPFERLAELYFHLMRE